MSNGITALLLGIGIAAWVYNKLMRSTGGNTQNSLIGGGSIGAIAFVVMLLIMNAING